MFSPFESGWESECFDQHGMLKVTLCDFQGWAIKGHTASVLFTGILAFGALGGNTGGYGAVRKFKPLEEATGRRSG